MGNGSADEQDRVRLEKAQAIGLFRFQLISPAIDDQLSTRVRGVVVRRIAQGWHSDPFGNRVRYSRDTVDRWIRAWRQGGFAALVPSPRQTALRTDADILEVAAALKRENPARTAAQVQRILVAAKGWAPSQSTLLRLFHRLELPGADGRTTGDAVFGRFEAGDPNELWTGDALHGRRRPENVSVRVHRRSFPGDPRAPVGFRRGHRPVGFGVSAGRAVPGSPTWAIR
ncbi:MAG TPA: helix-turn-helix domain-containing protein [Nakamurella sp.]